jgi:hypothetical protein
MTKTVTAISIVLLAIGCSYLSISTKIQSNQDASISLAKSLDQARIDQVAKDKIASDQRAAQDKASSDETTTRILSLLDRQLDQMKGVLETIQKLGDQNHDLAKQNLDLGNQLKTVQDTQSKILNEHSETLKKASNKVSEAVVVAKENQVTTQKEIRKLRPKPVPGQPLFHGWFPKPTPTPKRHR